MAMYNYNPGKYYLISVDEKEDACCISPFDVERVEQSFGDCLTFDPKHLPPTVTKVFGTLYGTMHILKMDKSVKDYFENITYEEIMDLIKE